jgi:predicted nucleotide-binding protein
MSEISVAMAKLAGIRQALLGIASENVSRNRSAGQLLTRASFPPDTVQHYFVQAAQIVDHLKLQLPDLFADFQAISPLPAMSMAASLDEPSKHFSRAQVERLVRDIDQIFEIRANCELAHPPTPLPRRVFISHGRSTDWLIVQPFIERDVGINTLELAQEANLGRTIIEKLTANSERCDSAVIVMTGDDVMGVDQARVRENVMHEIGYFQGVYGRDRVILLHEDGVNIPTNLAGVAYIPFPKAHIEGGFHVLHRELRAIYNLKFA